MNITSTCGRLLPLTMDPSTAGSLLGLSVRDLLEIYKGLGFSVIKQKGKLAGLQLGDEFIISDECGYLHTIALRSVTLEGLTDRTDEVVKYQGAIIDGCVVRRVTIVVPPNVKRLSTYKIIKSVDITEGGVEGVHPLEKDGTIYGMDVLPVPNGRRVYGVVVLDPFDVNYPFGDMHKSGPGYVKRRF